MDINQLQLNKKYSIRFGKCGNELSVFYVGKFRFIKGMNEAMKDCDNTFMFKRTNNPNQEIFVPVNRLNLVNIVE